MSTRRTFLGAIPSGLLAPSWCVAGPPTRPEWRPMPAIPDREGFAGMFAGRCGDALVLAGGANFPGARPWEGGVKHWYDAAWRLDEPEGVWRRAGRLPRPSAYGVSVDPPGGAGFLCAGGGDAARHFVDVYRLTVGRTGEVGAEPMPPLPRPCAFAAGAAVGDTWYIAGGIDRPDATDCLRTLWALDLRRPGGSWRELEPCPGPGRMLAVAGSDDSGFHLFSGASLHADARGRPVRTYLRDAWRYRPGRGWRRLADPPRAAVAAPSPSPRSADGRLWIVSGDDGTRVDFRPEAAHPGFPRDVLAYDPARDRWEVAGEAPFSRATAPTVAWRGRHVVPGGEARPGYRSPEVWALAWPVPG